MSTVTPLTVMVVGAGAEPLAAKFSAVGPEVTAPSERVTFHWVGVTLANEADRVTWLPWASYVVIEVTIGLVLVVSPGRLPPSVTFAVALGGSRVPIGSWIAPTDVLVLIAPLTALQPWA